MQDNKATSSNRLYLWQGITRGTGLFFIAEPTAWAENKSCLSEIYKTLSIRVAKKYVTRSDEY